MPRKCVNGTCRKVAILKRPKTTAEPDVLPEESHSRRLYGQYAQESLEKAIRAVREDNLTCCQAAKQFSVPRSTLKNYLQERSKLGVKPGRKRSVPEDVENDLVDKAIAAAEAGFSITKKEFLLRVEMTAKKMNLDTQFRNGVPGNDYWRAVKTRRPDLVSAIRKSDSININMKKSLKVDNVTKYFDDLEKLLTEIDLFVKPGCIWNADELGIQYCAEPVKILTKRGTQNISDKVGINRETNNAILCVNAIGHAMPPLFVVNKGETKMLQKFSIQNSQQGSIWTVQENVWASDQIMTEWFREVFLQNCGPDRPQLLIMDNHGSQEMFEFLDAAKKEKIHIIALPPRSSHWLEPLDRGLYMPFQKSCRKHALQFMFDNPTLVINYETWPSILCQVWEEVMTAELIMRAFEITGIYPLDRTKIPKNALTCNNDISFESSVNVIVHVKNNKETPFISELDNSDIKLHGSSSSSQLQYHQQQQQQQQLHHLVKTIPNPNLTVGPVPVNQETTPVPVQNYPVVSNPSFMTTDTAMFPVFST